MELKNTVPGPLWTRTTTAHHRIMRNRKATENGVALSRARQSRKSPEKEALCYLQS